MQTQKSLNKELSFSVWEHILFIVGYITLTYLTNILIHGNTNLVHSAVLAACLLLFFYGYCYLVRRLFDPGRKTWPILFLILLTAGLPLLAYVLVYGVLPWLGVVLYKPGVPFRMGEFFGKTFKAFGTIWMIVMLYYVFIRKQLAEAQTHELERRDWQNQQEISQFKSQLTTDILQSHHFKNCLNSIVSRAAELEDDYIPSLMPHLTHMLDYSLEDPSQHNSLVAIERELESFHNLADSLRIRLGHRDVVVFRQQGQPRGQPVPRLTLVTLLENVIKHGYVSVAKPVTIDILLEPYFFRFTCTNFLHTTERPTDESGHGLPLVQRLLAQLPRASYTLNEHVDTDTYTICLTLTYNQ